MRKLLLLPWPLPRCWQTWKTISAMLLPFPYVYTLGCAARLHTVYFGGVISSVIRSENLHLTADAQCAVTWLMKSKVRKVPWAALRCGLTKRDWAGRWMKALSKGGLPGEDFILHGCSRDFTTLRPRVASYSDGVNCMRMLLVSSGMEPHVALSLLLYITGGICSLLLRAS